MDIYGHLRTSTDNQIILLVFVKYCINAYQAYLLNTDIKFCGSLGCSLGGGVNTKNPLTAKGKGIA